MSKNSKTRNAKQNAPKSFSLAGWAFLVMEGPDVQARGHIVHSPTQGSHHLVQFGDPKGEAGVFFRMLSNDSVQQGTLHPNQGECDKFVASTQAAYARQNGANDSGGGAPVPDLSDTLKGDDLHGLPPEEQGQAQEPDNTPEANVARANQRFVGRHRAPEVESTLEKQ